MNHEVIKDQVNRWYQAYSNDIYQYIFFMIKDHDHAKDLMHDTFIRSFDKFYSFQGGNERGWLFKIARNLTIDFLRKKRPVLSSYDYATAASDPSPYNMVAFTETERELYNSLDKLKKSYKDVIVLRKLKEFSIKDTAEILGWSESKVKITLFRAMADLKKQLEKEGFSYEKL